MMYIVVHVFMYFIPLVEYKTVYSLISDILQNNLIYIILRGKSSDYILDRLAL